MTPGPQSGDGSEGGSDLDWTAKATQSHALTEALCHMLELNGFVIKL